MGEIFLMMKMMPKDVLVVDKNGIMGRATVEEAERLVKEYGWTIDPDSDKIIYCQCEQPTILDGHENNHDYFPCGKCYKEICMDDKVLSYSL